MEKNEVNHSAHSTWKMSVPYRIRTEIPQESDIRTIKSGHRTNTTEAV